jgi:hypothetical protein
VFRYILTQIFLVLLFAGIYNNFFNDIYKHYIYSNKINKKEYIANRILNSLYISLNIQTTTGYTDIYFRSIDSKIISSIQLLISLLVTGQFFLSNNNYFN